MPNNKLLNKLNILSMNKIRDDDSLLNLLEYDSKKINENIMDIDNKHINDLSCCHKDFIQSLPEIPSAALLYTCEYLFKIVNKMKDNIDNKQHFDNLYDDFEYIVWILNETYYKYKKINNNYTPKDIYSEYKENEYSIMKALCEYNKCIEVIIKNYPNEQIITDQHERMCILNHIILSSFCEI